MVKNSFLFFRIIFVSFAIINITGCKKSEYIEDIELQNKKIDKSVYIVLTGESFETKSRFYQPINRTKTNSQFAEPVQIQKYKESFWDESFRIAGVVDNYVCIQEGKFDDDYRDDPSKHEYTLGLYAVRYFDVNTPFITKTFTGFPGTAFYQYKDKIFIGCKNEVRLATIKNKDIQVETLHKFDLLGKLKTVDVFVPFQNYLLAIDDVLHPYYGFVFSLDEKNFGEFITRVNLPTSTNLHYESAISDGEDVYALAGSGYQYGSDQFVYSLRYGDKKFYINYLYHGTVSTLYKEPQPHEGHFYPNLCDINLLGDKILLAGMGCIVELNKNPKKSKKSKNGSLNFVVDFNNRGEFMDNRLDVDFAVDDAKLHEFDGTIRSIAIDGDVIYALKIQYEKKPKFHEINYNEYKIQRSELLVLKYDETNKTFNKISSIEVDKNVTHIELLKKSN